MIAASGCAASLPSWALVVLLVAGAGVLVALAVVVVVVETCHRRARSTTRPAPRHSRGAGYGPLKPEQRWARGEFDAERPDVERPDVDDNGQARS
jgi:hypothetical protein